MWRQITGLIFLAVAASGAQGGDIAPDSILERQHNDVGYVVYFPKNYSQDRWWGVLVFFHGATKDDESYQKAYGTFREPAEKYGLVIVSVHNICADKSVPGYQPQLGWYSTALRRLELVVVDGVRWLLENSSINEERIFVAGFSGGGIPTYYFAMRRPDIFRGFAAFSGNFYSCSMTRPARPVLKTRRTLANVLAYISMGENDHSLILEQAPAAFAYLRSKVKRVKFDKIPGLKHAVGPARDNAFGWFMEEIREEVEPRMPKMLKQAEKYYNDGKGTQALIEFEEAAKAAQGLGLLPEDVEQKISELEKPILEEIESYKKLAEEGKKTTAVAKLKKLLAKYETCRVRIAIQHALDAVQR